MSTAPAMRCIAQLQVQVAPPIELGRLNGLERRMVPILGGSIDGEGFAGTILPGGSDVQTVREDGVVELVARYAVDLGEAGKVFVENSGIRRMGAAGTPPYFRGRMRFEAPAGPLGWLNDAFFITTGHREGNVVHIQVFALT